MQQVLESRTATGPSQLGFVEPGPKRAIAWLVELERKYEIGSSGGEKIASYRERKGAMAVWSVCEGVKIMGEERS